jgi:hypothetical protein
LPERNHADTNLLSHKAEVELIHQSHLIIR